VLGFSKTIEATELLEVAVTHDSNGGVIDTDRPPEAGVGEIVDGDAMLAEVARMLDEAHEDLLEGSDAFPFDLSTGYTGFNTPSTFSKFNRAMKARVAAYQKNYAAVKSALAASFLNASPTISLADLEVGVYHAYSTTGGDQVNNLTNRNIYAHPTFASDAQSSGNNRDERAVRKTTTATPGSGEGLSSNIKYTLYTSASSRLPIVRNEELILLRAEARWFDTPRDVAGATADLNLVRAVSGGLAPIAPPATDAEFVSALLYERRYSLAFEGHRWIDVRRFDRIMDLPLDAMGHVRNVRYPIPQAECDGRPGEPRCMLGSM
jgi:hypothetical protein